MTIESNARDSDLLEREWQLQQQAHEDHRQGRDPTGASARLLRYRLLEKQLEAPLDTVMPTNFAHDGAHRIEAIAAQSQQRARRFEHGLITFFAVIYGVTALVAFMVFGRDWLSSFASSGVMQTPAAQWLLITLGCIAGAQWLALPQRFGRRH